MKTTCIIFILFLSINLSFGQSLSVFDVDASNFPVVKAKFFAFDKDGDKKLSSETLKITQPNGGEKYLYSNEMIIKWEGISEADTCILDFSLDNGVTWNRITDEAYGLQYVWKNIPKTNSDLCKIRIQQRVIFGKEFVSLKYSLSPNGDHVNNVSWSPNGDRIAQSSDNFASRVWNTDTGEFVYRLDVHLGEILNTTWNKDGSKLITASDDRTCIIRDNISGKMILKFDSLVNSFPNAQWSPDGSYFITIKNTKIVIRDAKTGLQLQVIENIPKLIQDVSWSPDGKKVVACYERISKVWNSITGEEIYTFTGHNAAVKIVSWSPDGSKILTASDDLTVKIWDVYTGKEIYTIPIMGTIFNVSWSPNGKMIAINALNLEDVVRIWDADTGTLTHSFKGHTGTVWNIQWKPDGNQIISVSHDHTAKIWDVNNNSLIYTISGSNIGTLIDATWSPNSKQIVLVNYCAPVLLYDVNEYNLENDLSDTVFSIIAPDLVIHDVNMNKELVGSTKDSLISNFIYNNGNHPFIVDSISITGADANVFSLVSGLTSFSLNAKEGKTVEMRFIPNRIGLHQGQLNVYISDEIITRNIIGEGVQPILVIENELIDFGSLEINDFKDTLQVATIKNIGNAPILITNTKHNYPNALDFTTLSGGGSFTLQPNDTHKMDLRFTASSIGRTSGTLEFHYDGVGSPAVVQLYGQGLGGKIVIDNDSAFAGEKRILRLRLGNNIKPKSNDLATGFKAVISYNPTLLSCQDVYVTKNYSLLAETIEINGKWDGKSNLLGEFEIIAGLGNADSTYLVLEEFNWLDENNQPIEFDVETQNGTFKLLGICYDGGARLINPNNKVELLQISPNPNDGNLAVELNLIEEGSSTLSIYNSNGQLMFEQILSGTTGKMDLNIDTKEYGNGLYFVSLQTPTIRKVKQMVVFK